MLWDFQAWLGILEYLGKVTKHHTPSFLGKGLDQDFFSISAFTCRKTSREDFKGCVLPSLVSAEGPVSISPNSELRQTNME
jgi:hypothetical protein